MAKRFLSRNIDRKVERTLWALAAGRCEFAGCNRPLFKSPVTQEWVNVSEKPHIYSFSSKGPRGWGPFSITQLNQIENLLLVCDDCHKKIDADKNGLRFSASILRAWKLAHETRIAVVTGISPTKKSHAVLYGANIGDQSASLCNNSACDGLFPNWYPTDNLKAAFDRSIRPRIKAGDAHHFSNGSAKYFCCQSFSRSKS